MTEQTTESIEKKEVKKLNEFKEKKTAKVETPKAENKVEQVPEKKETEKKDKKSSKPEIKIKKYEAIAHGNSLPISKKHSMYISNVIKGMKIDDAIAYLEKVIAFKQAVPMKGEIPHRKGNMMSGRYPINASKHFILMLKGLKGNVIVNGMELERTRIVESAASWASRPARSGGRRAKRINLIMKAKEFSNSGGKK